MSPAPRRCKPCVSPVALRGAAGLTGTAACATGVVRPSPLTHPEVREHNVSTPFRPLSPAVSVPPPLRLETSLRALTAGLSPHGFLQEPDDGPRIVWAGTGLEGHGAHRAATQDTAGRGESSGAPAGCLREHLPLPLPILERMGSEGPTGQGCSTGRRGAWGADSVWRLG